MGQGDRKDSLHNLNIFSSPHPNLKLAGKVFDFCLKDICEEVGVREESTDDHSKEGQSQGQEFSIENYAKFAENQSVLDELQGRQLDKEEHMLEKNICDVDFKDPESWIKPDISEAIDSFLFGKEINHRKKFVKGKKRKRKSKTSEEYSKYLKQSMSNTTARMTMDRLSENNQLLPYICYPCKQDGLSKEKKKLNATDSLYGSFDFTK